MQNSVKPGKGNEEKPVIFTFEGKGSAVQEIDMTNLGRSIRRESGLAGIRSIPIQYWTLYATILTMIESNGFNYEEKDIYVQNNSSKAYLTDEQQNEGYTQKSAPINRWRFDKIISTIQLPGVVEGQNEGIVDARNAAIGLTLNKEGLSVAFGMNVHACMNFNVLGGTVMHSYGHGMRDGLPWDVMKTRLEMWFSNMNQIWSVQNDIMKAMKDYTLQDSHAEVIDEIIGDLYVGAIKQAYFKGSVTPFNTHELSDFVKEIIQQRKEEEQLATVWSLYNWGTSIMKPGQMDIGEISNNSNMWSNYLIDRFALDVPKNIPDVVIPAE